MYCTSRQEGCDICREVSVQWTTRDVGTPVIKFGTSPGQYGAPVPAKTGGYTRDILCGVPANSYGYFDPVRLSATSSES